MVTSIDSISISFDWNDLNELESSLRNLEIDEFTGAAEAVEHCQILRNSERRASEVAVKNAVELAKGHADLAVLLLEPADTEATKLNSKKLPPTIKCIDKELARACSTRNWRNTCILDIRPFRSRLIRHFDSSEERDEHDDHAYSTTRQMLNMLEPDVLLICQSETSSSRNDFARSLSSSVDQFGKISLHPLESGKQMIVIYGFHLMYAEKYTVNEDPVISRIRKAALRFLFLQAVNILNGRVIRGPGVRKLQDAFYGASRMPHILFDNGMLNPTLDDRFKGTFLADNASHDFSRLWKKIMSEKSSEESQRLDAFASLISHFDRRLNAMNNLDELRAALPMI